MSRLFALTVAAVLFTAGIPTLASAEELPEPVRRQRPLLLTATGEALLAPSSGSMAATGLGGLQLSYNVHPNVALDLSYRTLGIVNGVTAGSRFFLLRHSVSPYAYVRAGALIFGLAGYEQELDLGAVANLAGGVGVEVSTRFGLNLFADAGADSYFTHGTGACGLRFAGGVGYRF